LFIPVIYIANLLKHYFTHVGFGVDSLEAILSIRVVPRGCFINYTA